jgi:steroid delta-isomerase-like uncharacterized protein
MLDLREIADRGTAAFNTQDGAAFAALCASGVITGAPGPAGRLSLTGRDAAREYNQTWFNAFPDGRITVDHELIADDCIVQECTFEGTNTGPWKAEGADMPATGKTLKGPFCQVIRVTDGRIASTNLYFDQVEVLTQLGLMPSAAEVAV